MRYNRGNPNLRLYDRVTGEAGDLYILVHGGCKHVGIRVGSIKCNVSDGFGVNSHILHGLEVQTAQLLDAESWEEGAGGRLGQAEDGLVRRKRHHPTAARLTDPHSPI